MTWRTTLFLLSHSSLPTFLLRSPLFISSFLPPLPLSLPHSLLHCLLPSFSSSLLTLPPFHLSSSHSPYILSSLQPSLFISPSSPLYQLPSSPSLLPLQLQQFLQQTQVLFHLSPSLAVCGKEEVGGGMEGCMTKTTSMHKYM